jgi:hypothetical protein
LAACQYQEALGEKGRERKKGWGNIDIAKVPETPGGKCSREEHHKRGGLGHCTGYSRLKDSRKLNLLFLLTSRDKVEKIENFSNVLGAFVITACSPVYVE